MGLEQHLVEHLYQGVEPLVEAQVEARPIH